MSPSWFFVFNVLFISFGQMVCFCLSSLLIPSNNINKFLLFSVTLPTYLMVLDAAKPQQSPPAGDFIYPILQFAFVYLAYEADQQQWG